MISLEGELLETDPGEFLERCGTGLQRWAIPFATSPDGLGVGFSAKCAALGGANTFKFVIVSNLENSKYTNRQPFYVWREFVECIVRLGLVNNDAQMAKLIRFCVDVVVWDQPKLVRSYRLRPLRKAKDANATQRIRESDKAKAWRATVFSEGVGIRAHFWRRVRSEVDKPDSKFTEIEFANLVKKTDPEEIPLND